MEKNNCQYTDKDIWNYYSNLLSRNEETEMQEHILSCNKCKKRLHQLRNIADSFDEEPDIDNLSNLEHRKSRQKQIIKRYIIVAASVAATIVILIRIVYPDVTNQGKNSDNEHPIYNIDSPSYSVGDTLATDSVDVDPDLDLDTLLIR